MRNYQDYFLPLIAILLIFTACTKDAPLTKADQIDPPGPDPIPTSLTDTAAWHTYGYCSGNYADDYDITENSITYNAGELGYWHNHALDHMFNNLSRIGNLDSLSSPTFSSFDSVRTVLKEFIVDNSPDCDDYTDASLVQYYDEYDVEFGGMLERLAPISAVTEVDSFANFGLQFVDSMYAYSFIDADARDVIYDLFDDITDGNSTIDFATVYDSLDVFYNSSDASSQMALSIIAIAEYSYCYWQDYEDYYENTRWIWIVVGIVAVDAGGACMGLWTNAIDHYLKGTFNSQWGMDEIISGSWQGAVGTSTGAAFGL